MVGIRSVHCFISLVCKGVYEGRSVCLLVCVCVCVLWVLRKGLSTQVSAAEKAHVACVSWIKEVKTPDYFQTKLSKKRWHCSCWDQQDSPNSIKLYKVIFFKGCYHCLVDTEVKVRVEFRCRVTRYMNNNVHGSSSQGGLILSAGLYKVRCFLKSPFSFRRQVHWDNRVWVGCLTHWLIECDTT